MPFDSFSANFKDRDSSGRLIEKEPGTQSLAAWTKASTDNSHVTFSEVTVKKKRKQMRKLITETDLQDSSRLEQALKSHS